MRCFVQFLTTPTDDTPGTTLMLHFDNKRYLLGNIGEGTQRACVQRKFGISKVEDIFLTGKVDWKSTGGIIGMILTLADGVGARKADLAAKEEGKSKKTKDAQGDTKLVIHGGENLTHTLATARRFVFRKGMPLEVDEFRKEDETAERDLKEPTWSDQNVQIWAMPISPEELTPRNERKRSHEEMMEDGTAKGSEKEEEDRLDQIRKSIVSSMFNSEWRLDALHSVKLKDVRMPASVFVRIEGKIEKYQGPLPGTDEVVPDLDVLVRQPWPGALIEQLPPAKRSSSAVSYIFKNYPVRGKFLVAEAKKLGVKPGPNFSKLSNGGSVTLDNGTVITPDMVLAPAKDGQAFAVVELPTVAYVKPLLARQEWSSGEVMSGVGAIIWILGRDVVKDRSLLAFMKDHAAIEHIVSSPECCSNSIALESPAEAAIKLNLMDAERFPIPTFSNKSQIEDAELYQVARVGKSIQLEPTLEIQTRDIVNYFDVAKVVEEQPDEILLLARAAREKVRTPEYQARLDELQKDIPSLDAEVVTLGTGSALPSKYRNVSATLLRVPGYGSYLFDCGENTLGQLRRVFGSELPEVLNDLKGIWISHLHADHHLGTVSVIKAWHEETARRDESCSKKLLVASAEHMLQFLEEYSHVEDFGHERVLPLAFGSRARNKFRMNFDAGQTAEFGLTSIQACGVNHCFAAMAVVFDFPNGLKVAYSGDCRPSDEFVHIGRGATLLIHEATFDDELQGDAIAKKHSTTSEALMIGKKMKARRILLTHFSQRYQKIPVMETSNTDQVAIVAFDYMRCKLGDFAKLSEFRPALIKLYEGKEE